MNPDELKFVTLRVCTTMRMIQCKVNACSAFGCAGAGQDGGSCFQKWRGVVVVVFLSGKKTEDCSRLRAAGSSSLPVRLSREDLRE